MTEQNAKRYGTEREIAEMFGLGVKFLRLERMRGSGPPWRKVSGAIGRTGGRVLYSFDAVRQWIEAQPGGGQPA